MFPLTLQEVIDRINQADSRVQDVRAKERQAQETVTETKNIGLSSTFRA